jgi:hypothetical protein
VWLPPFSREQTRVEEFLKKQEYRKNIFFLPQFTEPIVIDNDLGASNDIIKPYNIKPM